MHTQGGPRKSELGGFQSFLSTLPPPADQTGRQGWSMTRLQAPGPSPEQASPNACTHSGPTRAHCPRGSARPGLGPGQTLEGLVVQPGPQHGALHGQCGALTRPHVPRGKCVAVHTAEGSRGPSSSRGLAALAGLVLGPALPLLSAGCHPQEQACGQGCHSPLRPPGTGQPLPVSDRSLPRK